MYNLLLLAALAGAPGQVELTLPPRENLDGPQPTAQAELVAPAPQQAVSPAQKVAPSQPVRQGFFSNLFRWRSRPETRVAEQPKPLLKPAVKSNETFFERLFQIHGPTRSTTFEEEKKWEAAVFSGPD